MLWNRANILHLKVHNFHKCFPYSICFLCWNDWIVVQMMFGRELFKTMRGGSLFWKKNAHCFAMQAGRNWVTDQILMKEFLFSLKPRTGPTKFLSFSGKENAPFLVMQYAGCTHGSMVKWSHDMRVYLNICQGMMMIASTPNMLRNKK